jgi:hypothetical protein
VRDFETWAEIEAPLANFTSEITLSSAVEVVSYIQSPPFNDERWAFRGQSSASWGLKPSIERYAKSSQDIERHLEHEFKRRAYRYLTDLPDDNDDLEWLALMQHYGSPTRLLDWTKSPYVAAFFAAESAGTSVPSAIWAIDQESVRTEALETLGLADPAGDNDLGSRAKFHRIYREVQPDHLYVVAPVQPYRMNERLTIQQGLFLCANNPLIGFERSLKSLLHHASGKSDERRWLHKIVIQPEARLELLRMLNSMNVNSATLFPGLDGFARSFRIRAEIMSERDWQVQNGVKHRIEKRR